MTEFKVLRIQPIFNVANSPDWNPIENVFSMLKTAFKKKKLMAMSSR